MQRSGLTWQNGSPASRPNPHTRAFKSQCYYFLTGYNMEIIQTHVLGQSQKGPSSTASPLPGEIWTTGQSARTNLGDVLLLVDLLHHYQEEGKSQESGVQVTCTDHHLLAARTLDSQLHKYSS